MTFPEIKQFLLKHNIPEQVIKTLPDMLETALCNEPVLDIYAFDDYLHEKYDDYEKEGKSMKNIFSEIFGEDVKTAEHLFLVDIRKYQ